MSPYKALFGKEPVTPIERKLTNRQENIQAIHNGIKERIINKKESEEKRYNIGKKTPIYQDGEEVLIKKPNQKLLETPYFGPGIVRGEGNNGTYEIEINDTIKKVNCKDLKKYPATEKTEQIIKTPHSPLVQPEDPFIGKRIAVYWPTYGEYYKGTVVSTSDNPLEGSHEVLYDDHKEPGEGEPYYEHLVGNNKAKYYFLKGESVMCTD